MSLAVTAPRTIRTTAERLASARVYLSNCQHERALLSAELADPTVSTARKDWVRQHGLRIADLEIAEVADAVADLRDQLRAEALAVAA